MDHYIVHHHLILHGPPIVGAGGVPGPPPPKPPPADVIVENIELPPFVDTNGEPELGVALFHLLLLLIGKVATDAVNPAEFERGDITGAAIPDDLEN